MLGLIEVEDLINEISYKPGWEILAYETPAQGIWIKIRAEVIDSYNPHRSVVLDIKSPLPPMDNAEDFYVWLRWRLERIEVHECHEWLKWKRNGSPLFNPHAEGADEPRW